MKNIAFCNLYEELNHNNQMFKATNVRIGDDLLQPMHVLKKYAEENKINVGTVSVFKKDEIDAFVFLDMPIKNNYYLEFALKKNIPCYLIIFESEVVHRENWNLENHQIFKKIFTWHDPIVDNKKYFKINFSGDMKRELSTLDFSSRKLCTVIAGNKMVNHPLELYSERMKIIRWFEKKYPQDFDLYGIGWDRYFFSGIFKKMNRFKSVCKTLLFSKYSSYKGAINRKKDVLNKYKFSICFENAKEIDGYITEKIFDCLKNGVVPIYYGPSNILEHIPPSVFIDYRDFSTLDELYAFMQNYSEDEYKEFLLSVDDFFQSKKGFAFSSDYFAQTIVNELLD